MLRHRNPVVAGLSALILVLGPGTSGAAAGAATPPREQAAVSPAPDSAPAPPAARSAHTVTYDGYSFMIDGKRTYLWSGEFHYFRLPSQDLWRDILQKMKAAGFNATSLYFDWGYHSAAPGEYDFTGVRDVDKLLDIADQVGIYVIARPGPYINAEVDGGGFPGWLSTTPGATRTSDPAYLKYSDQWQTQIDRIIARHQLTDGRGSVIQYQVENEYYNGSPAGRAYMKHLEDKATADGITVPLVGNNNGTFSSGDAALDVDAADSYPQGFDCSNPTKWNGVPDISYAHAPGKPLGTAEFQGGAFDPWGGPGYDQCAQLINDQFANVFYKQNIAVGATEQSFYMTYGGTNWGWLSMPQNYTSYDYGAAIRENRQLDPKYYQDKLIGYFTQAVAPLTRTDAFRAEQPDSPAIVDTGRINTDTGTQFHVLRHADSTSTAVDKTHIAIDFAAKPGTSYTYDDVDPALSYTGTWSHVANQSYTGGDYKQTESFSETTGDSLSVPFTGTAVQWIGSKAANHGLADVYLDGVKKSTIDSYGNQSQAVLYSAKGLPDGPHTLKIVVTGQKSADAQGTFVSIDAINVPPVNTSTPSYPVVPQQPGTAISLNGRDSKIIVANYILGGNRLQYSTSEIMTDATISGRDVAVLYGARGDDGETVLRYQKKPTVTASGGAVRTTWDGKTGDLRLNYTHRGLARVQISGGGSRPMTLLLADTDTAKTFWRLDTKAGPVLVRGTHLLRSAVSDGEALALSGDNATDNSLEVFSNAASLTWNGRRVRTQPTGTGSRVGVLPVAAPIILPALTKWRHIAESPEAQPAFDDSSWQVADKTTSNSTTTPGTLPVLFADDYGFHTGSTWYRGRFADTGKETGITLSAQSGGGAAASSAWLNGVFLGSSTADGPKTYTFPAGALKPRGDNIVSVLTVNMGHEEDYNVSNGNKAARGLTAAGLVGAPVNTITWRLQGVRGGEQLLDQVRGPLNTGGLYGERAGYYLPGYPTAGWKAVQLPATDKTPGVSWYRTQASLKLPKGQDTSLGLTITDDPSRRYRAEIYVNGWQMGNYVNYLGPQHSFPIPNGVLNPNGKNDIAIAVWNLDGSTGGLGTVALTNYGSYASSLTVAQNPAPRYNKALYTMPAAPKSAVSLHVPPAVSAGQQFTATATVRVSKGQPAAKSVTATLQVPAGWTVSPRSTPGSVAKINGGSSATFRWSVTAPAGTVPKANALIATAHLVQAGRAQTPRDERIIGSIPAAPPSGSSQVSELPFLSSTNGWGPVERDHSNGESQPGDGRQITIAGTGYAKGLGTNAPSDVQIYLAGTCTRFTAKVGVDGEVGGAGTVTFSVLVDGKVLTTTPVLKGGSAPAAIDVPITGGQVLELVVNDGGDGNGNDHADWAEPVLSCG